MKLVVPIRNMLFYSIIRLGSVVFIPCISVCQDNYEVDEYISDEDRKEIEDFIANQQEFIKGCAQDNLTLALMDIDEIDLNLPDSILLDEKCYIINRSLDYIRINYSTHNNKYTLPGEPGVLGFERIGFIVDTINSEVRALLGNKHYFYLQQGIGLDFNLSCPKSEDPELYNALFSDRSDEVYNEFRMILERASRSMNIHDINLSFCFLFWTIERMASKEYKKFEIRKKMVISWISKDQREYDTLNNQLYFFSKSLRTEIVHKGRNILEFITTEFAEKIIQDLYLIIFRFAMKVINSGITHFDKLYEEIEAKSLNYTHKKVNKLIKTKNFNLPDITDLGEKIIIVPIENLHLSEIIVLGKTIFLPANYIYKVNGNIEVFGEVDLSTIYEILLDSEVKKFNKDCSIAIFRDNYQCLHKWNPEKEFDKLDLICKKVSDDLNYLILTRCNIRKKGEMPDIPGIHNGFRKGLYFDVESKISTPILGRSYGIYNKSDVGLTIEDNIALQLDKRLYNCLYNNRSDEVFINCRNALSRVCECLYLTDETISIAYLLDTIDMLDPFNYDINISMKKVLHFICIDKKDFNRRWGELERISDNYRTPIVHYGKSIGEFVPTLEEIHGLFDNISNLIVEYCKEAISTNITDLKSLDNERIRRKNDKGIR